MRGHFSVHGFAADKSATYPNIFSISISTITRFVKLLPINWVTISVKKRVVSRDESYIGSLRLDVRVWFRELFASLGQR